MTVNLKLYDENKKKVKDIFVKSKKQIQRLLLEHRNKYPNGFYYYRFQEYTLSNWEPKSIQDKYGIWRLIIGAQGFNGEDALLLDVI